MLVGRVSLVGRVGLVGRVAFQTPIEQGMTFVVR